MKQTLDQDTVPYRKTGQNTPSTVRQLPTKTIFFQKTILNNKQYYFKLNQYMRYLLLRNKAENIHKTEIYVNKYYSHIIPPPTVS